MENIWLNRAKRIQAIASCGLHYTDVAYDRERYEELAALANEMLSDLGNVPVSRIEGLVPDFAKGYATPRVDVRGAVIEDGRVLLVREKTDGNWALPGGFADVGRSPAENIVKEIAEEAGIVVTARHLYDVRHKARHRYPADTRDFYKLHFLCDRRERTAPEPGSETMEAAFFAPDALPPLSLDRTLPDDITTAFTALREAGTATRFD
ncbi:NUDIX hydrolase [Aestuariivita sp.]|jgi:ADP-ribose pyrophosphatase YjhB (NUDIX family)|uniref:NUDIX hydrolase n=1 Tax=Aestuariivita sp. TaxID=1872407 RepID=UPI00216E1BB0|nr:NUDIX hydrolase [Aestuariivita sp.]MCE8006248.1 NUDIX hydrolase [Aestuariivita sp.]